MTHHRFFEVISSDVSTALKLFDLKEKAKEMSGSAQCIQHSSAYSKYVQVH